MDGRRAREMADLAAALPGDATMPDHRIRLFVALALYRVYFTPLFITFVRYHWGHEFMAIHFLVVGYLFY